MDVQLMTNYLFKLHIRELVTFFRKLNLSRSYDSVYTMQTLGLIYFCRRNERKISFNLHRTTFVS
jgi:hypothetical protein